MILYAIVLHLVWALTLYLDDSAANATAVASIRYAIPRPFGILAMLLVAGLAVVGLSMRNAWHATMLMIPQQFLLLISAGGAFEAMWEGQFADGVVRPTAFIVADQMPAILAAIGHVLAIFAMAREAWSGR